MAKKKKTSIDIDKNEEIIEEEIKEEPIKEFEDNKKTDKKVKTNRNVFTNTILFITILCSLGYLFVNIFISNTPVNDMINILLLVLFSIIYLGVCISYKGKKKFTILISSILLMVYFLININTSLHAAPTSIYDLRGKSITEAMKWASKNNITLEQDYEYSDMVPEYTIISQKESTNKSSNIIKVSVSEGPNPSKEVIVPSMVTWDSERVINFVKKNYLNNVVVEFIESDKVKDTVIEQSVSGNLKRDDELKLIFSYGDEGNSNEVKLIDFTNKSKFEIEFFIKQHHLNYEFNTDFSNKIKKGYGLKQSVSAGKNVSVDDKAIIVTLSKGPKIKVPDLKNMSSTKITEWAVKNKLKLEFIDKYDDSIKEGNVISIDKEKGEILEQGTVIKVTLSKGKLKMPKFNNIDDFTEWADKYDIKYEIKREFNKSVKSGEIISFSIKPGKTIKNDDIITVKVSDGDSCEVPNLKGLTKSEAISRLKKANLEYNFVYKSSDTKKDKVLSQSISSGSDISCGTTITVTLSSGKDEASVNKRENKDNKKTDNNYSSSSSNNNSNTNNNTNNNNNNGGSNNNTPAPYNPPAPTCNACNIRQAELKNIIVQSVQNGGGYQGTANAVISFIEGKCPGINVQVRGDSTSGKAAGMIVPGSWSGGDTDSCSTVNIILAQ